MIFLPPILTMKKSVATTPAAEASAASVPAKRVKFTPPVFDAKNAVEIPHTQLYAHSATGCTVGFHQPVIAERIGGGEGEPVSAMVHLFGVNRRYIATVQATDAAKGYTPAPPAKPAPAPEPAPAPDAPAAS